MEGSNLSLTDIFSSCDCFHMLEEVRPVEVYRREVLILRPDNVPSFEKVIKRLEKHGEEITKLLKEDGACRYYLEKCLGDDPACCIYLLDCLNTRIFNRGLLYYPYTCTIYEIARNGNTSIIEVVLTMSLEDESKRFLFRYYGNNMEEMVREVVQYCKNYLIKKESGTVYTVEEVRELVKKLLENIRKE